MNAPVDVRLTLEEMAFGCERAVELDAEGPCVNCEGSGRDGADVCAYCDGAGRMVATRTATVEIPPGVSDGDTVSSDGGAAVVVRQRAHPVFERDGLDLLTVLRVPPRIMDAGGVVEVETLEDAEALLGIEPGSADGDVARMEREGMPSRQDPNRRGDLLVTLEIGEPEPDESPAERGRSPWSGLPFIVVGFAIVVVAFLLRLTETFCDPAAHRCVVVVDGAARGELEKTVAEQRSDANAAMLFTALIGVAFMVPGFWMMYKALAGPEGGPAGSNQRRPE